VISNILKLAGLLTVVILGTFVLIMFRADRHSAHDPSAAHDGLRRVT
jgi:hypothetical protein